MGTRCGSALLTFRALLRFWFPLATFQGSPLSLQSLQKTIAAMFDSLSEGLQSAFKSLRGKGKLTEANMRDGLKTVETAMLEADVNYEVVQSFMEQVTEKAVGRRVLLSLRPEQELIKIVNDELIALLGPVDSSIHLKKDGCTILMLCGLQGSGKTTTCGKLAQLLLEQNIKPTLVAADLQRPAAIEQLKVLGAKLGVPVHADLSSKDPSRFAKRASSWPNAKVLAL